MKKALLLILLSLGLAASYAVSRRFDNHLPRISARSLPKAAQIPAFELQNVEGGVLNAESLKGKWSVLYLGFTRCPDACPTTLAYFRGELDRLSKEEKENLNFLLVSVDPERDSASLLKDYVKGFHPDIQAARGPVDEVKKLAKGLMTTFHKEEEMSDNLYMMAHSPHYYLVDPEARFHAFYEPPLEAGQLANDLKKLAGTDNSFWGL